MTGPALPGQPPARGRRESKEQIPILDVPEPAKSTPSRPIHLRDRLKQRLQRVVNMEGRSVRTDTAPGRASEQLGTIIRGRVVQMNAQDLHMAQGSVLNVNKRLGNESYLTETLTPEQRQSVILPTSRLRSLWDTVIAVLVSYTAIMLPIQLCYDNVPLTLPEDLIAFDIITDIVFLTDIVLNFRTGYVENAKVVVDRAAIRKRCARGGVRRSTLASHHLHNVPSGSKRPRPSQVLLPLVCD